MEWKRSMMGLMMSLSQKMTGMECRLAAVEAATNRMAPMLDAAWGALQALISQEQEQEQEQEQGQEQGPEPSGDEDEEDEAEETLRENGAESGNGGDVVMG